MVKRLPKFCSEDVDRHGNIRVYFRRTGVPKARINGVPWSEPFMEEYRLALAQKPAVAVEDGKARPGTWRWLCQKYFAECIEYKKLKSRGRSIRRRHLEATFAEPLKPGSPVTFEHFPLEKITTKALRVLRDRKMDTPEQANSLVKHMRAVCKFGIDNDYLTTNPAKDLEYKRTATEGFHTWTVDEVEKYVERHPPGSKAHLALSLLLYTGVRRSDVVQLGRQHVRAGWLKFSPEKGRDKNVKTLEIPMLPQLASAIEAAAPSGHLTYLVTEFGKPFTPNGFGNYFKRRCREAKLDHCSAHGLRKAGATLAAENGATEHQLMAIFGWSSARMAELYTRKARQKRLAGAAMHLISTEQNVDENCPTFSSEGVPVGQKSQKTQ